MDPKLNVALLALQAIAGGEYENNPFIGIQNQDPRDVAQKALEAINLGGKLLESYTK
jgi:hypothetical protein